EQVADEILVARPHADAALAAPSLAAVRRDRGPLDVAGVADRDRHVLFGDQVLDVQVARRVDDLAAALVAVALPHVLELPDDDLHQQTLAGEDGAQPFNRLEQLGELVENLLPLQAGQALQLHVQDGLGLDRGEVELRDQAVPRLRRTLRSANQRDDGVEMVERDPEPFEDVIPRFGLSQLEFRAAANDFAPELDDRLDHLEQVHHLRPPADDGEHDDAEAELQLRVLVEVVENDVG